RRLPDRRLFASCPETRDWRDFQLMRKLSALFSSLGVCEFHVMRPTQPKSLIPRCPHFHLVGPPTPPPPAGGGKSMQNYRKLRYASCVTGTDDLRGLVRLSVQFAIVYDLACSQQLSRSAGNPQSVGCKVPTSEQQPSTVAFGKGHHHDEPARTFHNNFAQREAIASFCTGAALCADGDCNATGTSADLHRPAHFHRAR